MILLLIIATKNNRSEYPIILSIILFRLAGISHSPAHRDDIRAILETKLNRELITTLENLNKSATTLQKTGLWLTAVIGIATIVISVLVLI